VLDRPAGAEADFEDVLGWLRIEQVARGVVDSGGLGDPDAADEPAEEAVRRCRLAGHDRGEAAGGWFGGAGAGHGDS
jgi:hypothetical protein